MKLEICFVIKPEKNVLGFASLLNNWRYNFGILFKSASLGVHLLTKSLMSIVLSDFDFDSYKLLLIVKRSIRLRNFSDIKFWIL